MIGSGGLRGYCVEPTRICHICIFGCVPLTTSGGIIAFMIITLVMDIVLSVGMIIIIVMLVRLVRSFVLLLRPMIMVAAVTVVPPAAISVLLTVAQCRGVRKVLAVCISRVFHKEAEILSRRHAVKAIAGQRQKRDLAAKVHLSAVA